MKYKTDEITVEIDLIKFVFVVVVMSILTDARCSASHQIAAAGQARRGK